MLRLHHCCSTWHAGRHACPHGRVCTHLQELNEEGSPKVWLPGEGWVAVEPVQDVRDQVQQTSTNTLFPSPSPPCVPADHSPLPMAGRAWSGG